MSENTEDTQKNQLMVRSAENALTHVLQLKRGEKVLIISDHPKKSIGKAFINAAKKLETSVVQTYILKEEDRPLESLPRDLETMLQNRHDIIINLLTSYKEETPFRIGLLRAEKATGARVGHGPGITEEMLCDGPLSIDFADVAIQAKKLIDTLEGATSVHITTELGTDVTLDVKDRGFITDMVIEPDHFGNLPPGEIWCGPVEDGTHGKLVIDGSIGDLGQVQKPLHITITGGKVTEVESADSELLESLKVLMEIDPQASIIGELGIGLNPKAKITGVLLEDEKAARTMHIAFGNNEEMPGGRNSSKTHRDFLFNRPTATVTYVDGSSRVIMKDGEVQ